MMKFITRALLLILGIVVLASDHFLFLPACFAAETSTNIPAAAATDESRINPKIMEAAEKGDPAAQTQVANSYVAGDRDLRDTEEAFKWYLRAAEQGYAPAQVRAGLFLLRGIGVKQDETQAWSWLRKAADQNDTFALYMAGRACEQGVGPFKKDDAEAGQWYRKSADYGYALAQHHLGRLCAEGRGMPRDDVEALKWFELVDLNKSACSNQLALIEANNKARLQLIVRMSAKEDAEARRRSAAFVPKTPFTNDYWVTYWDSFPKLLRDGTIETIPVPIVPRTGPIGPISVSFMGRTQVIDTASSPFIGPPGTVETILVTNFGLTGTIQTISSGFSPNPAPAPPASRNTAQMVVDVPIKIDDFRPIISASVNGGKALRFFFDAGSSVSYISEKAAARLKLKSNAKLNVGGQLWDSVQGATLAIGGASFTPKHFAIRDSKTMQALDPFVDGLIGADLLQSFVVELDYRKGRMRLRDPAVYKYTGPGDYLFMRFERGRPYVSATVTDGTGRTLKTRLLLATVTRGSLFLERQFAETNALKESVSRSLPGKVHGVDGSEEARYGQLTGLQLGHYFFQNPPTIFLATPDGPGEISGYIGGAILSRFNLIFHSGRQQLILIPNDTFPQPTLRTDSASEMFK